MPTSTQIASAPSSLQLSSVLHASVHTPHRHASPAPQLSAGSAACWPHCCSQCVSPPKIGPGAALPQLLSRLRANSEPATTVPQTLRLMAALLARCPDPPHFVPRKTPLGTLPRPEPAVLLRPAPLPHAAQKRAPARCSTSPTLPAPL